MRSPTDDRPGDWRDLQLTGLSKFGLGNVPASITPPRTWERARWFAVITAVVALMGLLLFASFWVRPIRMAMGPDWFHNLPTGSTFDPSALPPNTRVARFMSQSATSSDVNNPSATYAGLAGSGLTGMAPNASATTTVSGTPNPSEVNTKPPATSSATPSAQTPALARVVAVAKQFYREVTSDASAALNLTVGAINGVTQGLLQQRYGDAAAIQVQSVSANPDGSVTSVLHVVNKDGSSSTQQRTLLFTLTGDPKISNIGN